jgi:hypothetical protein
LLEVEAPMWREAHTIGCKSNPLILGVVNPAFLGWLCCD